MDSNYLKIRIWRFHSKPGFYIIGARRYWVIRLWKMFIEIDFPVEPIDCDRWWKITREGEF